MMKLYRKNEILFAVLAIVVYVVVCGNLRSMGDDNPYMTLFLLAYAAVLFVFVKRNGLTGYYGLSGWARNNRQMLYFLPLWVLASGNLWGGIVPKYTGTGLVCAVISFALVGFVEEMIFRGFLFRAMLKDGKASTAIIVSAVTFGVGHIVNLLTGHGSLETFVQMGFAVAVGFLFTMAYFKSGSLWPVILSHSLIDVFSVFSGRSGLSERIFLAVTLVMTAVYCLYLRRVKTPPAMEAERG